MLLSDNERDGFVPELSKMMALRQTYSSRQSRNSLKRVIVVRSRSKLSRTPSTLDASSLENPNKNKEK